MQRWSLVASLLFENRVNHCDYSAASSMQAISDTWEGADLRRSLHVVLFDDRHELDQRRFGVIVGELPAGRLLGGRVNLFLERSDRALDNGKVLFELRDTRCIERDVFA